YFMGMGIYRSKGFFWLPGRPDMALLWNQAAGSINLEFISYWNSGVLADPDNHLTHEERSVLQKKVNKTMGRFGDRRCHLTIIGRSDEVHDFTSALINCFLSEEEIVWWQSGGVFADPWPVNISRLN
ncbi:cobalamin biosynthesis protein CobW, partial [Escherichia coli]|nr:cobalamin biosynthesis protein CobW [Escherichia coli]